MRINLVSYQNLHENIRQTFGKVVKINVFDKFDNPINDFNTLKTVANSFCRNFNNTVNYTKMPKEKTAQKIRKLFEEKISKFLQHDHTAYSGLNSFGVKEANGNHTRFLLSGSDLRNYKKDAIDLQLGRISNKTFASRQEAFAKKAKNNFHVRLTVDDNKKIKSFDVTK